MLPAPQDTWKIREGDSKGITQELFQDGLPTRIGKEGPQGSLPLTDAPGSQ